MGGDDKVLKRTPLYPLYAPYGARTIDFGGWEMPVQFREGIIAEHQAVRNSAGLFDVSHMGEIEISGPNALKTLQKIVTNDVSRMSESQAMYSPVCNDDGGTVDDILIYRLAEDRFLCVVNAGNIDKDYKWFTEHNSGAKIVNQSDEWALLALQGPKSQQIMDRVATPTVSHVAYYTFAQDIVIAGANCMVSRTGYTGEDGFEIYISRDQAKAVFEALLVAGSSLGLIPVGLGARDTLRLEARLPLYGHELRDDISPLEAGLGPFVKLDKGPFIGRNALVVQKANGLKRKIVGFILEDRGVARADCQVLAHGQPIGYVTSGTLGPALGKSIGLALIEADYARIGNTIQIDVRGKLLTATIVKTPFYKRNPAS